MSKFVTAFFYTFKYIPNPHIYIQLNGIIRVTVSIQ